MALLDGVRIGPLDPDKGESFGQIGGQTTARRLLRHHTAMHPPALRAALSRIQHDERSGAIDIDEANAHIREVYEDAGEALPDESRIVGHKVRGQDEQPELQVLSFTYTTAGNRTGKGFVPYRDLPKSVAAGDEAVQIKRLKDAGLPWAPSVAAQAAAGITGTGVAEDRDLGEVLDEQHVSGLEEENEELRAEVESLRARIAEETAQREADAQAATAEAAASGTIVSDAQPARYPSAGEPWEGYEGANAQDVVRKLREEKDPELAERVLAYEKRADGGGRSTVISAAEQILDRPPAG